MKFDVVLSNTPFVRDGEWVMPEHIQVHVNLVAEQGYYAGIMTRRIMKNDSTLDTKFTRHYWKRLDTSFNYASGQLYYYIWKA